MGRGERESTHTQINPTAGRIHGEATVTKMVNLHILKKSSLTLLISPLFLRSNGALHTCPLSLFFFFTLSTFPWQRLFKNFPLQLEEKR